MAVFASRQIVIQKIAVTITGSGDPNKCYATINGAKQYSAGTHEVNAGDTITFGVYGTPVDGARGFVKIDGTEVLSVTNSSTKTYNWIVPSGISTIEIAMKYYYSDQRLRFGRITVTTA